MSILTHIEIQKLERELGMSSGYVLGFSNRTFADFFRNAVGIDIFDAKYNYNSGSKANRLRAFWNIASTKELVLFMDGLLEGWDIYSECSIPESASKLLNQIKARILCADPSPSAMPPNRTRFADISFDVALSFPGAKRDYVSIVASQLQASLGDNRVFYDLFYQAHLAKPNLDILLQGIYKDRASLVVVFLSADYAKSDWCGLEWRAVRDIIKAKSDDQLMFIRFDDEPVDGTFGIDGYIDARKYPAEQTAKFIIERVADVSLTRTPPPTIQQSLRSNSTDEIKRQGDIAALRWALESIHLPTLDDMIDGLPRYVNADAMHFWEGFNGTFRNSLFHIYDSEVSKLIKEIHQLWGACFDGCQYHSSASPNVYIFGNPGDIPLSAHQQLAWDRIVSARNNLRIKLDELLGIIRDRYLEIDINMTNKVAWKDFVDFKAQFESSMTKRGASGSTLE